MKSNSLSRFECSSSLLSVMDPNTEGAPIDLFPLGGQNTTTNCSNSSRSHRLSAAPWFIQPIKWDHCCVYITMNIWSVSVLINHSTYICICLFKPARGPAGRFKARQRIMGITTSCRQLHLTKSFQRTIYNSDVISPSGCQTVVCEGLWTFHWGFFFKRGSTAIV